MPSSVPQRLLALYGFLVSRERPATRGQIRAGIEVYRDAPSEAAFERMFERDKGALRGLGTRVLTQQSAAGPAYSLEQQGSLLERPELSAREKLLVALASRMWSDPRFAREAQQTARRLGVDPAEFGGPAEQERWEPALHGAGAELSAVLDALGRGLRLEFAYLSSDQVPDWSDRPGRGSRTRQVSPWGLGQRYGNWYLHGWDHQRRAPRTFRLSRCQHPAVAAEPSRTAPQDFSMDAVLDRLSQAPVRRGLLRVPAALEAVVRDWAEAGEALRLDPSRAEDRTEGGELLVPVLVHDVTGLCSCLAETLGSISCTELEGLDPQVLVAAVEQAGDLTRQVQTRVDRTRQALGDGELPAPRRSRIREDSARRFVRLVDMLSLVSDRPGISVPEIARHFGMSSRQIHQDLESIATAGDYLLGTADLRLESSEGEVYVRLVEGLAQPLALSPDQTLGLLLGLRLWAEVSPEQGQEAQELAQKILSAAAGDAVAGQVSVQVESSVAQAVDSLRSAVAEQRPVEFSYRSRHEVRPRERQVLPLRVHVADAQWLLEAQDLESAYATTKTFRIDAVGSVRLLSGPGADQGRPAAGTVPSSAEDGAGGPEARSVGAPGLRASSVDPADALPGRPRERWWVAQEAGHLVAQIAGRVLAEVELRATGFASAEEEPRPGLLVEAEVFDRDSLSRFLLHHPGLVAGWDRPGWLDDWEDRLAHDRSAPASE